MPFNFMRPKLVLSEVGFKFEQFEYGDSYIEFYPLIDGVRVGQCAVKRLGDEWRIIDIFVNETLSVKESCIGLNYHRTLYLRACGIGTEMLKRAIIHARIHRAKRVAIRTIGDVEKIGLRKIGNIEKLIRFYKRIGFSVDDTEISLRLPEYAFGDLSSNGIEEYFKSISKSL